MGMFNSIRVFITTAFDQGTDALETAGEALGMATDYVHNRAVTFREEDMATVATASAERQAELQTRLEGNEKAAAIYNDLIAKMQERQVRRSQRHK